MKNVGLKRKMLELSVPFSTDAWVRALDGKLGDHGKIAEAGLESEFPKWLKKFNERLNQGPCRVEAWNSLKSNFSRDECTNFLSSLYLFTYLDKTAAHALRDRFRLLKEEIDALIPTYSNACERTQALLTDNRLACVMLLNAEWYLELWDPLHSVIASIISAKQKLAGVRTLAKALGSGNIYPQDAALYYLVSMMRKATGKNGLTELANLIEAAYGAHGARGEIVNEEQLSKRLQRFKTKYAS